MSADLQTAFGLATIALSGVFAFVFARTVAAIFERLE